MENLVNFDFENLAIRLITVEDSVSVARIYKEEVLNSTSTFDLRPRTDSEQKDWIMEHLGIYASVVAVLTESHMDTLIGFASLSPYRNRPGYATSAESSIYIDKKYQGMGVGKALLSDLIQRASSHGFHTLIARISGTNEPSMGLHISVGYELVGVEKEIGRKFGHWLDVSTYQLMIPVKP